MKNHYCFQIAIIMALLCMSLMFVPVKATADPITVTNISMDADYVKKDYFIGEELDTSGLTIVTIYNNGKREILTDRDYTISEVDLKTYGSKSVFVSYGDIVKTFEITVNYKVTPIESCAKYTNASINLYNGPGNQFEIVTTVPMSTKVNVIGEVDNGWMKIQLAGVDYFCCREELSDVPYNDIVVCEAGASQAIKNKANAYWNENVPDWLKRQFVDNGWKIVISGTKLSNRFGFNMSVAGITHYDRKIVYLDNRESVIKRAMIHEIGHAIDYIHGLPSQSDEFKVIFNAEKYHFTDVASIGDGHEISSSVEYFAQVFNNIVLYGKDSLGNISKTYEFMSKYINVSDDL